MSLPHPSHPREHAARLLIRRDPGDLRSLQGNSCHPRNQAHRQIHALLGVLAQIMLGQDGTEEHTEQRAGKDADCQPARMPASVIAGQKRHRKPCHHRRTEDNKRRCHLRSKFDHPQ